MDHLSDEVLSAWVEGELEPGEAGRIAEHVASCVQCRGAIGDLRHLRAGAAELGGVEPSDRVWQAIQPRVALRGRRGVPRWAWFSVPLLAAAGLVGFIVAPRLAFVSRVVQAALRPQPVVTETAVAVREDYAEYVRGIDAAISDCEDALRENPGNARVRAAYSSARSSRATAFDRLVSDGE